MNEQTLSPGEKIEEKKSPAFHLFLYLVSFFSLGFLIQGIITIFFQLINKQIREDELDRIIYSGQFSSSDLKFGISSLIISLLVYYIVLYFINKKLLKGEIRNDSLVRKYITYVALFIFAAMAIGSLVFLINNYLGGELTSKSALKILVFFIVSAFFFCFYMWEVRRHEFPTKPFATFYGFSLALSLAALITGLVIMDSPKVAREKRMDSELVNKITSTNNDVAQYYKTNNKLPDPKEFRAREGAVYKVANEKEYELCASFKHSSSQDGSYYYDQSWEHPAGNHCYRLNIDQPYNPETVLPSDLVR